MRHMSINRGFTLVEVLVISPIIILFIGAFIGVLVSLTGESLVIREKNAAAYDTQAALEEIETSISQATAYLVTTGAVPNPQGSDNLASTTGNGAAFTNTNGSSPDTLIISSPATTASPNDPARSLIYTGTGACDSKNPLYNYMTVYFVADDTETTATGDNALFRRTILPPVPACAGAWQRGSCRPDRVTSTYAAVCKRKDERLVGGVSTLDVQYFVGSSATPVADNLANTATDASVNLNLAKSIAGSNVTYGASSRTNSVNIQSSGPDNTPPPANPAVTYTRSDTLNPYNTTVTWGRVGSATSYNVRYRIQGVETTKSIGQPGSGTTVSAVLDSATIARKQSVQLMDIQVVTNAGNYMYNASMPTMPNIDKWTDCTPQNGWQNYGNGFNDLGFTKTKSGAVGLKGLVRFGSVGAGVCSLPASFAPQDHLIFPVLAADPATGTQSYGRVDIYPNGAVYIAGTPSSGNGWVSLDGIIYMTAAGNPTWTGGGLISPWYFNNYGGDTYAPPKYYRDSRGRAWVQGLASGGQPNYRLFWMTGDMAPQYGNFHTVAASDNRGSSVNINASPDIVGRPSSGGWVSTQFLYYATGGLYDMYLYNGWANYNNGWSLAKCYRGDDDITILQGLVNGGNTAGVEVAGIHNCGGVYGIPTMSTGRTAILPGWSNWERASRLDLSPNNYLYGYSVDAGWTSLDGIHFIAD